MQPARADYYQPARKDEYRYIHTMDGLRVSGKAWNDSDLAAALAADSVHAVFGISPDGKERVRAYLELLDPVNSGRFRFNRADFVYKRRFTRDEAIYGPQLAGLVMVLAAGFGRIRQGDGEYDWRYPLYGLAAGVGISLALTLPREKTRVYLKLEAP